MSKRARARRATPIMRNAGSPRRENLRKPPPREPAARSVPGPGGSRTRRTFLTWASGAAVAMILVAIVAVAASGGVPSTPTAGGAAPSTGSATRALAPDGSFTTAAGARETVFVLHGQPALLWFVTTWCSSCQAGTRAVSKQIPSLAAQHVRVVELELARDSGQPGPGITTFASQLAGDQYDNPDWTFGNASAALTRTYDPNGYLDVYYLLNARGQITYANSSPAATMSQLLAAVDKITRHA